MLYMLYTHCGYPGNVYWAIVCYNKTSGYLEKVDTENNIINLIPRFPINIDFNTHNYRTDRRKISIIFGTFLFVDITNARYEIIQTNHYPAAEVKISVSSVCLAYSTCRYMYNGYACLICSKHID